MKLDSFTFAREYRQLIGIGVIEFKREEMEACIVIACMSFTIFCSCKALNLSLHGGMFSLR